MLHSDVVPKMLDVLSDYWPEKYDEFVKYLTDDGKRDLNETLEKLDAQEIDPPELGIDLEYMILEEMYDAMNEIAPPHHYFGSNEGDSTDYGFWVYWEEIVPWQAERALEGLTVNDDDKVVTTDGAPSWLQDMIYEAHDGAMPNDFVFETVYEVLDILAYMDENPEHAVELELQPDIYNHDLIEWLKVPHALSWADEAVERYGSDSSGIAQLLMDGQLLHKEFIAQTIINYLEDYR
jgi:hypothetical protein